MYCKIKYYYCIAFGIINPVINLSTDRHPILWQGVYGTVSCLLIRFHLYFHPLRDEELPEAEIRVPW